MDLEIGLASLTVVLFIQILCVQSGTSMVLESKATHARSALVVLAMDPLLYFAPMYAAELVSAAHVPPAGFVAALTYVAIIIVFAWAVVWIAARLFSTSPVKAFLALLAGWMLFALVLLVIWGILAAAAALTAPWVRRLRT